MKIYMVSLLHRATIINAIYVTVQFSDHNEKNSMNFSGKNEPIACNEAFHVYI